MNRKIEIKAADDKKLSCTFFSGQSETEVTKVIIIQSAVGVKRGFYSPLAGFLAKNGYHVYTMDYRGIGDSGDPSTIEDGIHTWGTLDLRALHEYVETNHPNTDLNIIGHSGGGWLLGYVHPPKNLKSLVLLNVGDGYFNAFPFPANITMYLNWKVHLPREVKKDGLLLTSKYYYGTPLPKNIALKWAEMGLLKGFLENPALNPKGRYLKSYNIRKLSVSFSDDKVIPLKPIQSMMKKFDNNLEHFHLHPKDINEKEMGHFGILKPNQKNNLWPRILTWLEGKSF